MKAILCHPVEEEDETKKEWINGGRKGKECSRKIPDRNESTVREELKAKEGKF
jgi:hypothetical protein